MSDIPKEQLARQLGDGVRALGLEILPDATTRLLDYLALLAKWNRTHNLTAVRDPAEMVTRHLLDSLAVVPYVRGPRVADLGSGGGLPGIPLACALPACEFVLIESRDKKCQFLRHATAALGLGNVQVARSRIEEYRPQGKFDTLVARALADLPTLLQVSEHLWGPGGRFLAMKGTRPDAELARLPAQYKLVNVEPLLVPGLQAERHLVIIEQPAV